MRYTYEYPRPAVTADVVVFTIRGGDLCVLLIRRGKAPFKGSWALPGGFVDLNESLHRAAARELEEETNLTGLVLEQLGAFGEPGRDPRGHTVSVAYYTFLAAARPVSAGDDASAVDWHPIRSLPKMAFDHSDIIAIAIDRLRHRLTDPAKSPIEIVPARFTLSELQHVHEAVHGRQIDKRNFRAKLLSHGLVEPVAAARKLGRHRPAQLYRFTGAPDRGAETVRIGKAATRRTRSSKRVR